MSIEDKRREKRNEYLREYRKRDYVKARIGRWNAKHRALPEIKERNRLWMAEWRKNNPDKMLAISRRNWDKNRDRFNQKRREKYKADPEYRRKKKEREIEYKLSGGRRQSQLRQAPKNRIRSAEYKKKNPDKVREYVKGYRKRVLIHQERMKRATLDDRYIVAVIKKSTDYALKTKDIPKELIALTKIKIFTHRKLKQKL